MKKDCVFQYATASKYGGHVTIKEDTDLITIAEAKELWKKYLPSFIKELQDGDRPEMAIWIDMEDTASFNKTLVHADHNCKTDGERIWEERKEYLDV